MKASRRLSLYGGGVVALAIVVIIAALLSHSYRGLSLSKEQLNLLIQKGEGGSGEACWCVHLYYSDSKDDRRHIWLQKAVSNGYAPAQYAMYHRVLNSGSPAEAVKLLQKAADQGQIQALTELGRLYAEGLIVERNLYRAEHCYREAATKGSESAMYSLSLLLADRCQDRNGLTEAYKWLVIVSFRSNPNTEFAQKIQRQRISIRDKAIRLGYDPTSLIQNASSQGSEENSRIPIELFPPWYGEMCNDLASNKKEIRGAQTHVPPRRPDDGWGPP